MDNTKEFDALAFSQRADSLIKSNFIFANKEISALLKCIMSIEVLTKSLTDTDTKVAYSKEFAKARIPISVQPGQGVRAKLGLPSNREELFFFVVCLLTEFDAETRNIDNFLKEFFYDFDTNESFSRFCADVIGPFKAAGLSIINGTKEVTEVKKDNHSVNDTVLSLISNEAVRVCSEILKDRLHRDIKREIEILFSTLAHLVDEKEYEMILPVWIGLKNTFKIYKINSKFLDNLRLLLIEQRLI